MRSSRLAISILWLAACSAGAPPPAGPAQAPTSTAAARVLPGADWSFEDGRLPAGFVLEGAVPLRIDCSPPTAERERLRRGPLAAAYPSAGKAQGLLAQLGGDYWKGPLDIGQKGKCRLVTTIAGHPDGGVGAGRIVSAPFTATRGFISFLVGDGGAGATRAELCVVRQGGCEPVPGCGDDGPGTSAMRRVVCDVDALGLRGRTVRLTITDRTGSAPAAYEGKRFIAVDDVRVDAERPRAQRPPAWGFADLHAHLFGHLGHGGRLIYGDVVGPMRDALADCAEAHAPGGRGFSTEFSAKGHRTKGYPTFEGWPRYDSKAHQQAYIDWIERAYRGGLRLVQMDVGNSQVFARAYETISRSLYGLHAVASVVQPLGDHRFVHDWDEDSARKAQLAAARDFAAEDASAWAAVATSPAEARDALEAGKLVLVLGVEADEPGKEDKEILERAATAPEQDRRRAVRRYVESVRKQGVVHVFPVHVMPNVFGAPAVYDRLLYCAEIAQTGALSPLADGMGDGVRYHVSKDRNADLGELGMEAALAVLLDPQRPVKDLGSLFRALPAAAKESCSARLKSMLRARASAAASPAERASVVAEAARIDAETARIEGLGATMSRDGLSPIGKVLVEEFMRAGMLVDLTHMSRHARSDTLEIAEKYGYPLMASHGGFSELAFGNTAAPGPGAPAVTVQPGPFDAAKYGTSKIPKTITEAALRRDEVARLRSLHGVFGVGLGSESDGVVWPGLGGARTENDCDGSSKSFTQRYRYAVTQLGAGIALGTDVNGFAALPSPRFENDACHGADGDKARGDGNRPPGKAKQPDSTRVAYAEEVDPDSDALLAYRVPGRDGKVFDLNRDGVAHYGLLPDFLQDMRKVGVSAEELAVLFRGVEDYLRMWEEVEIASARVRAALPDLPD